MPKTRPNPKKEPTAAGLYSLAQGYWASGVLFAALGMKVFDRLEPCPLSCGEVAAALKITSPWAEKLLAACVALGLAVEDEGKYSNTRLASLYLVSGKPEYQGDLIRYFADLWERFGEIAAVVAKGQAGPRETAAEDGRSEAEKRAKERTWILAMHNIAMSGQADALCRAVDVRNCTRLLDAGGGPGTYSVKLAQAHPNLRAVVLDAPEIVSVAGEIIARFGMESQVTARAGDFLLDEYGEGWSAVLFSGVLHGFPETGVRRLLKKGFRALESGGLMIVQEMTGAGDGRGFPFPALFNLNMMNGAVHSAEKLTGWLLETGFIEVQVKSLRDGPWFDSCIVCRKP